MDRVETVHPALHELKRIRLNELKRVAGLRVDVDTHHVETGPVVPHSRAASTAEKIKNPHGVGGSSSASARFSMVSAPAISEGADCGVWPCC